MGSGSRFADQAREEIQEFLDAVIHALRGEKIKVRELTKTKSTDDGEYSFPVTIGYECTLRRIKVVLSTEKPEVKVGGVVLGDDILTTQMPGTHVRRYELLKSDMAERKVMQDSDDAMLHRQKAEQRDKAPRVKSYAGLVAKIRRQSPTTRLPTAKKR